jgi:hypothetical protein
MGGRKEFAELIEYMTAAVDRAELVEEPFYRLDLRNVFPPEFYRLLVQALPDSDEYRPMSGRSKDLTADGRSKRVKIDLFPEYTRFLPEQKREIWDLAGRALCSNELRDAFIQRLAPGLKRRFGDDFKRVGMFPIPVLTRDIAGYSIAPHTDTRWKGITVLIYLPSDEHLRHIGTVVHGQSADGVLVRAGQSAFVPNCGLAFAVGDNTWHSVDTVGPEVVTRDLIILQYFVDSGLTRVLRNRSKRVGNFLLNEARHLVRLPTRSAVK